ncbi:MAG: hypothetical protein ACRDT4_25625, partial [Micromonosporaceae bacterium]
MLCGAPPDPLGIEHGQLTAQLAGLDRRDLELRHAYADLTRQRRDVQARLQLLSATIAQRLGQSPAAAATAAEPEPTGETRRRPSPRPQSTVGQHYEVIVPGEAETATGTGVTGRPEAPAGAGAPVGVPVGAGVPTAVGASAGVPVHSGAGVPVPGGVPAWGGSPGGPGGTGRPG